MGLLSSVVSYYYSTISTKSCGQETYHCTHLTVGAKGSRVDVVIYVAFYPNIFSPL